MLGGLIYFLLAILGFQWIIGAPLAFRGIPKPLQKPSKIVMSLATKPPGVYVYDTILVCVTIIWAASIWEVIDLKDEQSEHDHSMMLVVSLQRTHAQLVILACSSILATAFFVPRLAHKIIECDKLKASLEALKKQAEGLSAEYTRMTGTGTSSDGNSIGQVTAEDEVKHLNQQVHNLLKTQQMLSDELKAAAEAQRKAELSLEAVTTQYKNLEKSYDELLERNRGLEVEIAKLGGSVRDNKKSD